MLAVEIRYFLSRYAYLLSGAATSSEGHNNPVEQALFNTFGPPRIITAVFEDDSQAALLDGTFQRPSTLVSNDPGPVSPSPPPPDARPIVARWRLGEGTRNLR